MIFMKKLISTLLFMSFILIFVSCTGNDNYKENTYKPNTENEITNDSKEENLNTPPAPEKEPSAYEQLNENEKIIFDTLLINFDWFYVPSSVKITKIHKGLAEEWNNCGETIPTEATDDFSMRNGISITLKLNLENESGNNAQTYISLKLTDGTLANEIPSCKKGHLEVLEKGSQRLPIFIDQPEFLYANPGKINKALTEYCNEMGYN